MNATNVIGFPSQSSVGCSKCGWVMSRLSRVAKLGARRAGDVELANVLCGDLRVRTHVDNVDACHMIDLLQVFDGLGDDLPGYMRLAKACLIGHEEAPGRILIAVHSAECMLSRRSLKVLQCCWPTRPDFLSHECSFSIARLASSTGSHTSSHA